MWGVIIKFVCYFFKLNNIILISLYIIGYIPTMRLLEHNSTSNNSSVLGSASGGSHVGSNGILSSSMQTNLGQLAPLSGSHADRLDASSDSAVSSMGSERVPSDSEWCDVGSDSAQEYHQT